MGNHSNTVPGVQQCITLSDDSHPRELFDGAVTPWAILEKLETLFSERTDVTLGEGALVEEGAVIKGPAIIGPRTIIRSGAYIRERVVIGADCVIGHGVEIKNSVLLDGCQIAHFNYVGDSVLGNRVHMAAGSIIANVRITKGTVFVRSTNGEKSDTGREKFGAMLGDDVQIGCNAVINPGSIVCKHSIVYPLVSWRGVLPEGMLAKSSSDIVARL